MVDDENIQRPERLLLTPQLLVAAYCQGMFPMAESRYSDRVDWYSPDMRAVLPLDRFRLPRSVRQKINRGVFDIRHDTAFSQVIRSCAAPRPGHPDTWINEEVVNAYCQLHELGYAHSVEAWLDDRLVGGLYGVGLAGAFFGESMFHRPDLGGTDASKVCLAALVDHLRDRGYVLLDVQLNSAHMTRFGTIDIPRKQYMHRLAEALDLEVTWSEV